MEEHDILAAPNSHLGFLAVMRQLVPSLQVLAKTPDCHHALCLVAGHTLECALKAHLTRPLTKEADRRVRQLGHELLELWAAARLQGLPGLEGTPYWLEILHSLHAAPYHLRYLDKVHGLVMPPAQPMAEEITRIATAVEAAR